MTLELHSNYDLRQGEISFDDCITEYEQDLTKAAITSIMLDEEAIGRVNISEIIKSPDAEDELRKSDRAEIAAVFNRAALTKADFLRAVEETVTELEDVSTVRLPEPEEITEVYEQRDRSKYSDPLDYLRKRWGYYQDAGILFQRDLRRLDPKLVVAVRAYCQRMTRLHPERADEFVANEHLPPGASLRTPDVSETVEGTAMHQLAVIRKRSRDIMAEKRRQTDRKPDITS